MRSGEQGMSELTQGGVANLFTQVSLVKIFVAVVLVVAA